MKTARVLARLAGASVVLAAALLGPAQTPASAATACITGGTESVAVGAALTFGSTSVSCRFTVPSANGSHAWYRVTLVVVGGIADASVGSLSLQSTLVPATAVWGLPENTSQVLTLSIPPTFPPEVAAEVLLVRCPNDNFFNC